MKSKNQSKSYIALLVFILMNFDFALAENKAHPVLSWIPPLNNNQFDNWKFAASSVALNNKIILNPTGRDLYGFIQNMWVSCSL